MSFSPLINQLIIALRCLPGVGPKSAQRIAFHILERDRDGGQSLAQALKLAIDQVGHCQRCRTLSETAICTLCANTQRDTHLLCVVETPIDVLAVEQTGSYRGYYFVLMGRLSPLDGIGPEELGMDKLLNYFTEHQPKEIILATNSTVEGEATALYIAELAKKHNIRATRIAHGMPMGGELEFVDSNTLTRALAGRATV